ncbi:SDR family oxidoreductase [Radicibacter daui]|uniref:SDR family oxidoreductase n=1 Tax=Radicibacter daui TaxID=3064829 RepID=UPI004046BDF4
MATVLVTGGSGFLAGHIILQLLAEGHSVRASLRSLAREGEVRATLVAAGVAADAPLGFFAADLMQDDGWAGAMAGCDYVLHVASPFPAGVPAHEDELILPAREGTLRVLRFAVAAGVRRVVMTSSFAAVGYGQAPRRDAFTEADWTDPSAPGLSAYVKSKAIAERAAWDFMAREGAGTEFSVVNPVGIFGPVLGSDLSASTLIIRTMLAGGMPRTPRLYFGVIDVRDAAALHLATMTRPEAKGERFLAVSGNCLSLQQVADALHRALGPAASRAPERQVPDWLLKIMAWWDPKARRVLPDLGKVRNSSSAKAQRLLGWVPRPAEEAIAETGRSLLALGLVPEVRS